MVSAAAVQLAPETSPACGVAGGSAKDASDGSLFSDLLGAAVGKLAGTADQTNGMGESPCGEGDPELGSGPSEPGSDVLSFLLGTRADAASAIATLIGQPVTIDGQPVIATSDAANAVGDPATGSVRAWVAPEFAASEGSATQADSMQAAVQPTADGSILAQSAPVVGQTTPSTPEPTTTEAGTDPLLPLAAKAAQVQTDGATASVQTAEVVPDQPTNEAGQAPDAPRQTAADKAGTAARAESDPVADALSLSSSTGQQAQNGDAQVGSQRPEASLAAASKVDATVSAVQSDDRPSTDTGSTAADADQSQAAGLLGRSDQLHRLSTEGTVRTDAVTGTSTDIHQRVIDQVVRSVSVHRSDGRTDMVVKLNPPDLGMLTVHLAHDASGMTSQIQATSDQVRGLLQAHLPALVDALAEAGVKLNSVQITSDPSFGSLMHNSTQEGAYQQQQDSAPRHRFTGAGASTVSFDPAMTMIASSGGSSRDTASYSWLA